MSEIMCATCGAPPQLRAGRPWCPVCGIWLVQHEATGEWVSYAEDERRRRQAEHHRYVHVTEAAVAASLDRARDLLPAGWRLCAAQAMPDWPHYLSVEPPPGSPDVTAYLHPPVTDEGWHVTVSDRVDRVGYPLYTAGGVRAASYTDLPEAMAAAVNAVRIACGKHPTGRPRTGPETGDQPS